MKKITITNAYTWYNKGDAGILLGIVNTLKQIYNNDIEINILSFTPEEDKKRYCQDNCIKDVYNNILNPHPYKHTKCGKITAVIKLIFRAIYLYFSIIFNKKRLIEKDDAFKVMNDCDIIVVCGGGFLGGKKYDSLMHVFQIWANTKMDKPVIMMGASIEPIKKKIIQTLTEKVLKKVDYVYARETITYDYLKTFLPAEKYTLIPDMAFMLEDKKEEMDLIKNIKSQFDVIFGITVRKWNFPNLTISASEAMDNYKKSIAEVITKYAKEKNAGFIFVPQVIVEHGDDTQTAIEIRELLDDKLKNNFVILNDDISPVEVKQMIWNFDYFVGTRMHSNIFATSMGIPTVAIAYEKKTNGIMETVGLQNYIVEIDDITPDKLFNKIEMSLNNDETIRNNLKVRISEIRIEIMNKVSKVFSKL